MGAETALAIIVALLWGPTAIWLIVRATRGSEDRHFESDDPGLASSAIWQAAREDLAPLVVAGGEHWVCGGCRSLNRLDAKSCYSCRTSRDEPELPVRMARPLRPPVPVMANASEPVSVPPPPAVAPSLTGFLGPAVELPHLQADGVPVMDVASVALPEAPSGLPVCPFLGLESDPTTWFDFPAAGNVCHAAPGGQSSLVQSIERLVTGNRRRQSIGMVHQRAACLTVAHVGCQRYAAAGGASSAAIQARAAALPPVVPPSPSVVTPEPGEERSTPIEATVAARPESLPVPSDRAAPEAPKTRRAKRSR